MLCKQGENKRCWRLPFSAAVEPKRHADAPCPSRQLLGMPRDITRRDAVAAAGLATEHKSKVSLKATAICSTRVASPKATMPGGATMARTGDAPKKP